MTKQATHVQPNDAKSVVIRQCDWGGYMVHQDYRDPFSSYVSGQAAFTDADQCADWIRSWLRNLQAKSFGPRVNRE